MKGNASTSLMKTLISKKPLNNPNNILPKSKLNLDDSTIKMNQQKSPSKLNQKTSAPTTIGATFALSMLGIANNQNNIDPNIMNKVKSITDPATIYSSVVNNHNKKIDLDEIVSDPNFILSNEELKRAALNQFSKADQYLNNSNGIDIELLKYDDEPISPDLLANLNEDFGDSSNKKLKLSDTQETSQLLSRKNSVLLKKLLSEGSRHSSGSSSNKSPISPNFLINFNPSPKTPSPTNESPIKINELNLSPVLSWDDKSNEKFRDKKKLSTLFNSSKNDIILRTLLNTSDLKPQILKLESVFDLGKTKINEFSEIQNQSQKTDTGKKSKSKIAQDQTQINETREISSKDTKPTETKITRRRRAPRIAKIDKITSANVKPNKKMEPTSRKSYNETNYKAQIADLRVIKEEPLTQSPKIMTKNSDNLLKTILADDDVKTEKIFNYRLSKLENVTKPQSNNKNQNKESDFNQYKVSNQMNDEKSLSSSISSTSSTISLSSSTSSPANSLLMINNGNNLNIEISLSSSKNDLFSTKPHLKSLNNDVNNDDFNLDRNSKNTTLSNATSNNNMKETTFTQNKQVNILY